MYYLETNKNPRKINKGARAVKSLCVFVIVATMTFSNCIFAKAEQPLDYGNYPIVRGVTNPQELPLEYNITDGGNNLRQLTMAKKLGVLDTQNGSIFPNRNLTNAEMLKAMVKLSGEELDFKDSDEEAQTKYKDKAIELEYITQEEIDAVGEELYLNGSPTMKVLNANISKVLNTQTKYNTAPEKTATRLDLANLIYSSKSSILEKQGIDIYSGQVTKKGPVVEEGKNKTVVTVKLDKNIVIPKKSNTSQDQVDKLVEENQDDSTVVSYVNLISQNDIPILTPSGITTDINKIWEKTQVNIYSKDSKILYVEQFNVETKEVVGVFESIIIPSKELEQAQVTPDKKATTDSKSVVKIKDYSNTPHLYELHPDVKIIQYSGELGDNTAVSKPVSANQLSFGQDVSLTVRNNVVTIIKGYVPVEEELNAYVPPESQLVTGVVSEVSASNISLNNNNSYTIGPETLIMKDGQIQDYKQIKDGDRVKLFFDDISSLVPSKIEVEGTQRQADKVIKAKIGPYLLTQKSLNLKDVKELQNAQWVDLKDNVKAYENIKIKGDIYGNSTKINLNKLKNYNNQEIYAVIAKNQGVPTIEKGKIRIGDSLKFEDSIDTINYTQNTLQIDNNLVNFDESTIIIKDGNIVRSGSLEKNITSNIETNTSKDAQIIVQVGSAFNKDKVQDYPYKIYRASIRDVFDYSILLGNDIENERKIGNYFVWQGGVWSRPSEGKETPRINFTEQTKIYDYDNNKAITIDELRNQQNLINESSSRPSYYNRQVYVVTKDDVAVSIAFASGQGYVDVNSQNMIVAKGVGQYQTQSTTTYTSAVPKLLIKNIYQYNSNTNKLDSISPIVTTDTKTQEVKKTQVRKILNLDKATVISNGKAIQKSSAESLKDKQLTIIFRQTRDKKTTDNIEELDAIVIIAE